MIEFQTPQISAEKVEDNRGTFTIEPLDRGSATRSATRLGGCCRRPLPARP